MLGSRHVNNAVVKNETTDELTATVLGNPVVDKINLSVVSKQSQTVAVLLTDVSGKILINQKQFINAGSNMILYNATSLSAGIYTLKIISKDDSSVLLKIVK